MSHYGNKKSKEPVDHASRHDTRREDQPEMTYITQSEKAEMERICRELGADADFERFMRGEPSHAGDVINEMDVSCTECGESIPTGVFHGCGGYRMTHGVRQEQAK